MKAMGIINPVSNQEHCYNRLLSFIKPICTYLVFVEHSQHVAAKQQEAPTGLCTTKPSYFFGKYSFKCTKILSCTIIQ